MEKQAIYTIRVNTNNADKEIQGVTKSMDGLTKSTEKAQSENKSFEDRLNAVNETVKRGEFTMRGANKLIQEYQQIAMQAGRESPVGQAAIAQAAALQDQVSDLRNEVTRLSKDGQAMQGALAIGQTTLAGYSAFQGVTAMLGVENEKLMQTMVKLQAAQATLNAVEQIRAALEKESVLMLTLRNAKMKAAALGTMALAAANRIYAVTMGTATGATKLFRIALISTGIGAIVVGIGLLIANFDKVTAAVKNAVGWFNGLGEKTKLVLSIMFPFIGVIRGIIAGLKALGIIESEAEAATRKAGEERARQMAERRKEIDQALKDNQKLKDSISDTYDHEIAKAKAAGKDTKELEREKRAEMRKTLIYEMKLLEESMRLNVTNTEKMQELMKQFSDTRAAILRIDKDEEIATIQEKTDAENESQKKRSEAAKKAAEEKKRLAKEAADEEERQRKLSLERQKYMEDLMIANIKDTNLRERMELLTKHDRERRDLIEKYGNDTELMKQLQQQQTAELNALKEAEDKKQAERDNAARKVQLELQIQALKDDFEAQMAVKKLLWQLEREMELANLEEGSQEQLNVIEKYRQKEVELKKEADDRKKQLEEELQANIQALQQRGAEAIQGLSDAVFALKMRNAEKGSAEELKLQKKQFQVNKAMQLSQATMDAARAITSSLAQSPIAIGPIPNPAGIASLAFATATGVANIAKIAATRFDGGGGGGFGGGGANIPSMMSAQPTTPSIQQGELTGNQQQESTTKVAVLESDITRTQQRIQDIEVRTTF